MYVDLTVNVVNIIKKNCLYIKIIIINMAQAMIDLVKRSEATVKEEDKDEKQGTLCFLNNNNIIQSWFLF